MKNRFQAFAFKWANLCRYTLARVKRIMRLDKAGLYTR
jgi:hypothetical protein